jgi:hypothetical protein
MPDKAGSRATSIAHSHIVTRLAGLTGQNARSLAEWLNEISFGDESDLSAFADEINRTVALGGGLAEVQL